MVPWKRVARRKIASLEKRVDLWKYRRLERIGGRKPISIVAYRGYGTVDSLYLKGRVLEDRGVAPPADDASAWQNLVSTYKRFKSNEIPYARVLARVGETQQEVVADDDGFFEVRMELSGERPTVGDHWRQVELELLEPRRTGSDPVHATGEVLVASPHSEYGVISDIDDTVLYTDATNLVRMAKNVLLSNARMRLPFPGVAAFYRALLAGVNKDNINPLLYVSSAPWNIYDMLCDFFQLQGIPLGPVLFLRNWGLTEEELLPLRHAPHKLKIICEMLDFYSGLPFILIGDSGQEDPEIYHEVVHRYPDRIRAVYIRNVSRHPPRIDAIRALAAEVADAGSTLVLADDTLALAKHAVEHGWISSAALPEISVEKAIDESDEPEGQEQEGVPTVIVDSEAASAAAIEDGAIERALEIENPEPGETPTAKLRRNVKVQRGDEGNP